MTTDRSATQSAASTPTPTGTSGRAESAANPSPYTKSGLVCRHCNTEFRHTDRIGCCSACPAVAARVDRDEPVGGGRPMRAHDMSRYWRLVNVSGGRVTGTFWVSAPTRNGSTWVKAVDVTVWDDDQHTWGRWVTDMTAAVQDGVVDLSEYMIDRRVRVDVLAQRAAVEAAILAAAEAVTWPEGDR